jgi:hypothetical protein
MSLKDDKHLCWTRYDLDLCMGESEMYQTHQLVIPDSDAQQLNEEESSLNML